MPITIGANITSLRTQRELGKTTDELSRVYERLSSGQRINHASDDAAGLAIVSALSAHSRVFTQGIRNFNDGLSLLSIADAALANLTEVGTRISELAIQAANGVYSYQQRAALDSEARQLRSEFNRIVDSTVFNGMQLLDGSIPEIRIQGGFGLEGSILVDLTDDVATGDGTFQASQVIVNNVATPTEVIARDLNHDGKMDFIAIDSNTTATALKVFIGNGDGTFLAPMGFNTGNSGGNYLDAGDFNGDGNTDVIVDTALGSGLPRVFLGNSDGSFRAFTTLVTGQTGTTWQIEIADVNGDGRSDLLHTNNGDNTLRVFLAASDGSFGSAINSDLGGISKDLAIGDVNHDGRLDIVDLGTTNDIGVSFGNGDGTFAARVSYSFPTTGGRNLTLADLDGDSNLDLIQVKGAATSMYVALGNSNGTFRSPVIYTTETDQVDLGVSDLNGDGVLDLAVLSTTSDVVEIHIGNGDGSFRAKTTYFVGLMSGSSPQGLAFGDYNGDGALDIVASSVSDDSISILLGNLSSHNSSPHLAAINLTTVANAYDAMATIEAMQLSISQRRSRIGASQSRIESGIRNLLAAQENYEAAASRIKDADVAADAGSVARSKILQEAASSILAQANQLPALALRLLQS